MLVVCSLLLWCMIIKRASTEIKIELERLSFGLSFGLSLGIARSESLLRLR